MTNTSTSFLNEKISEETFIISAENDLSEEERSVKHAEITLMI